MLPTTGYFKNFSCPFYETCICERPYCHYRHFKQDTLQDANVISDLVSKAVHKVLNSTSKSSEKEDKQRIPTYNPTPIATLNKYKTNNSVSVGHGDKRQKRAHIPYSPEQPIKAAKLDENPQYDVGDYVNTSVGYSPTPKSSSVQYIPSAIESLYQNQHGTQTGLNQSYEPVKLNSSDNLYLDVKYNPTNSDELSLSGNTTNDYVPNYNDDFIDNFLSDPNIYEPTEITAAKSVQSSKTSEKSEQKPAKSDAKHSKSDRKPAKCDTKTSKSDSKTNDNIVKNDDKHAKSKKSHYNSRSSSSSSKNKTRSKSEPKVDSSKSIQKSSSQSDRRRTDRSRKDDTKRTSTSKENGKTTHKENGKSSSSNHKSSKDRDKTKRKSSSKEVPKPVPEPEVDPDFDILSDDFFDDDGISDGEIDMNTLEQCKRIFDEYQAAPVAEPAPKMVEAPVKDDSLSTLARKRTAHEGRSNIYRPKSSKPNQVRNAAMVMAERYKNIMANLKEKRNFNTSSVSKKDELVHKIITETPKSIITSLVAQSTPISSKPAPIQAEHSQISGRNSRIAHVPNVSSLINAKKKIAEIKKKPDLNKTPMTTVAKGSKRVAHTPEFCTADIPPVLQSEKSKLAVNVRTRFLLLMVTECMKIYDDKEASYERALNEELSCYLKCSVLTTYRNSCMLSINRLRKESEGIGYSGVHLSNQAREFLSPRFYENVKGWVLTEQQLIDNGYPRPGATKNGFAVFNIVKQLERVPTGSQICIRCRTIFQVNEFGYPVREQDCIFHPARAFTFKGEARYLCCRDTGNAVGCCVHPTHVYEIRDPNNLSGFVCTFEPENPNDPRSVQVFALDCEMVYTTRGFELARVTIIDSRCVVIYESLVQPLGQVLDCNTRFSGITMEMLAPVRTKITDVQAALLHLFNSQTILIGHSLESDLKALRLIHCTVIDTAVLFPHRLGPPKKRGLRVLASEILKKIIQNSESGHDSAEDAVTCMELVIWRLREELKTR